MAVGGDGRGQLCDNDKRVLTVALESEGLAVGPFYVFHDQIGMQLHAHAAGGLDGFEIDFCSR